MDIKVSALIAIFFIHLLLVKNCYTYPTPYWNYFFDENPLEDDEKPVTGTEDVNTNTVALGTATTPRTTTSTSTTVSTKEVRNVNNRKSKNDVSSANEIEAVETIKPRAGASAAGDVGVGVPLIDKSIGLMAKAVSKTAGCLQKVVDKSTDLSAQVIGKIGDMNPVGNLYNKATRAGVQVVDKLMSWGRILNSTRKLLSGGKKNEDGTPAGNSFTITTGSNTPLTDLLDLKREFAPNFDVMGFLG